MNVLMLSLLYPRDQMEEVTRNARDKLQNQINNYQWAFIEGIRKNLAEEEKLDIVNSLPVGIYPVQYKQLFLSSEKHDHGTINQLGCLNLPFFKQKGRMCAAVKAIEKWIKQDVNNRTLLLYTQYLPYMEAVKKIKKKHPNVKVALIVTDLPNELGLPSGRTGLMKRIEYRMGEKSLRLCQMIDGFVLLTEPMAQALKVDHKPHTVIEGLIQQKVAGPFECNDHPERPAVLYTGTLEKELGIPDMLKAFAKMPQYDLWICGQGGMRAEVETACKSHPNIHFYGFVPQEKALALQAKATALINPRTPEGVYTRYSFPSKTLEYLRSGKPVVCYRLEGIPSDYDPHLFYIEGDGEEGIIHAVEKVMHMTDEERRAHGQAGRHFVEEQKNPTVQCKRLVDLLRRL